MLKDKIVVIKKYERFYEEDKPEVPILVAISKPLERRKAYSMIQEKVKAYLENGYKLMRGPEGLSAIYEKDSKSKYDHHIWFTLSEDKKGED